MNKSGEKERFAVLGTKEEINCEKLSSSTYFEDNRMELGCKFGIEASYVIKKPNDVCDLFLVNQIQGAIVKSPYGANYFSGDKRIVTLTLKSKTIRCNEELYSTDQDDIYVVESNTIEAQNIRNEVPKLSNTAKQFVDIHIKLHGIFEKLEAGTKKSIDELVQNECINTIRMINMLIQNPQQSEESRY